jgi:hypothetical protein
MAAISDTNMDIGFSTKLVASATAQPNDRNNGPMNEFQINLTITGQSTALATDFQCISIIDDPIFPWLSPSRCHISQLWSVKSISVLKNIV